MEQSESVSSGPASTVPPIFVAGWLGRLRSGPELRPSGSWALTSGDGSHVLATRIVSRLMSSSDPAVNLRPISRSAATACTHGPGDPARMLVRLPDPAAVSHTRRTERTDPAATERSGRRLSPGVQAVSTPIVSTPDTRAVSVQSRRDQFRAIRVSSPWLTGRQSPRPTEGSKAQAIGFVPSESVPRGSQAVVTQ